MIVRIHLFLLFPAFATSLVLRQVHAYCVGTARLPCMAASEPIVSFSQRALAQLVSLREQQGADEICIRMGVRAGGCSGMSYVMDVMQSSEIDEADTVIDHEDGIKCVVDPKSLMFLYGLNLDYSDALIGGGFSFHNPNAEQTCGCGKSFDV
eukprot:CAMPEP_0119336946 /NCGR_PEP_ID=MMETSP1333-20130426/92944_1 /TAXON_ID=418940 /ORGANISM="Scyphosphaera apsteinii, Strain RCC1455" /LENGTH=151 /DNA_ID=CAMNT_0007347883 /DNA_START=57 /DNA_END=512 /DNA_ORIENTATION=-